MMFTRDRLGRISVDQFNYFIYKYEAIMQAQADLSQYDIDGSGSLFEQDLEHYLGVMITKVPLLSQIDPRVEKFYKCAAIGKLFFMLDPRKTSE